MKRKSSLTEAIKTIRERKQELSVPCYSTPVGFIIFLIKLSLYFYIIAVILKSIGAPNLAAGFLSMYILFLVVFIFIYIIIILIAIKRTLSVFIRYLWELKNSYERYKLIIELYEIWIRKLYYY